MNNATVWERVLSSVQGRINHESFNTWFRPITFIGSDPEGIHLGVPDKVFEDWILSNYQEVLDESLDEAGFAGRTLSFEVVPDDSVIPGDHDPLALNLGTNSSLPFHGNPASALLHAAEVSRFLPADLTAPDPLVVSLNQRYTFETFVV